MFDLVSPNIYQHSIDNLQIFRFEESLECESFLFTTYFKWHIKQLLYIQRHKTFISVVKAQIGESAMTQSQTHSTNEIVASISNYKNESKLSEDLL